MNHFKFTPIGLPGKGEFRTVQIDTEMHRQTVIDSPESPEDLKAKLDAVDFDQTDVIVIDSLSAISGN